MRQVLLLLLLASPALALGKPKLHELVIADDLAAVAEQLPSKKIDKLDKKGNAPLHYAAAATRPDMLELLLRHGADVNVRNKRYQTTALHEVARSGARNGRAVRAITTLLLERGADASAIDKHGETPLIAAARIGNAAFVDTLIAREKVDPGALNEALLVAREHSRYPVIRLLETRGVRSELGKDSGLLSAVALGDYAMTDNLVSGGASLTAKNDAGATPLIVAAEHNHTAIVGYLLDRGADPNAATSEGKTALHAAADLGNRQVIEMLIDRGADVNADAGGLGTPLNAAAKRERVNIANYLLERGATPVSVEGDGEDYFGSGLGLLLFADYQATEAPESVTLQRRETAAGFLDTAAQKFEEARAEDEKLLKRKKRNDAIMNVIAGAVATTAMVGLEHLRQQQIAANRQQTAQIMALSDATSHDDYFRRVQRYEAAMINPEVQLPYQMDFSNASLTNRETISGLDVSISEYERRIALSNRLRDDARSGATNTGNAEQ